MDCDGGSFALRRPAAGNVTALNVMAGALSGGGEGAVRPGFVISACGLDAEHEVRVVPRAGRGLVEIGFTAAPAAD
jgi:hypothetical protein